MKGAFIPIVILDGFVLAHPSKISKNLRWDLFRYGLEASATEKKIRSSRR